VAQFNLGSIFPGHLNIEADQANLLVLRYWLQQLGHDVKLHAVTTVEQLADSGSFDFILVGHGVPSAWKQIEGLQPNIQSLLRGAVSAGVSGLMVASGWDRFENAAGRQIKTAERKSLFASGTIEQGSSDRVFGYVNTTTKSPVIAVEGDFLLTQLHGPLFAKNSWLTQAVINRMLAKRGLPQVKSIEHYPVLQRLVDLEALAIESNEYVDEPLL